MTAATFDYENLNPRRPTVAGRALKLIPGVRRVASTTRPYAAWWRERNLDALRSDAGPLWVVLGDSMSQGIGASAVERGWVPRVAHAMRADGVPLRVLNLSFSGARTADVLDRQLPALQRTGAVPDVLSVMIGSNDLVRRSLREALPGHYAALLSELPEGTLVATWPGGGLSAFAPLVQATRGVVPVPLRFTKGAVAADRYHPNDQAYEGLAEQFLPALRRALAGPT